jgi:hypothetical protein
MTATPGYVVLSTPQSKYTVGSLIPLTATFYDLQNNLVDPGAVTIEYSPAGTTTVTALEDVTQVSTGVYTGDLDTTGMAVGDVLWEAAGTGACQANGQDQFTLDELPF